MALNFKQLKKISKNPWSFVLSDENNPYGIEEYFDTGCYALNAFLSDGDIYKGCILGKKYAYSGESSTAKSYFTAYKIKSFLDTYDDGMVVFYETEGSSVRQMAEEIGIDMDRVIIEPVSTVEDLRFSAMQYIDKLEKDYLETKEKTKLIVVLDSLGMLSSNKEIEDGKSGKDTKDMTMAQMKKAFYRAISLKFSLLSVPMITVNHTYTNIGGYGDSQVESGGSGFQYAGDVRFLLSKSQKRAGNIQTGVSIRIKVKKSRFIKENQTIVIDLDFEKGLNKYSYMVEFANACGMLKASENTVTFEGQEYGRQMFEEKFGEFFPKEKMDILRERIKESLSFGANDNIETMSVDKLVAHGISMGIMTDTARMVILPDGTKIKKNELRANEDLIPEEIITEIKNRLMEQETSEE
jgi:hypothetical protein